MADKIHQRLASDLPYNSVISVAIVADPYSDKGENIQVTRSLRDDPLAGMLSRRQIDEAQFQAGRKFQFTHEQSTIGRLRAIDPGKEAVDGGLPPDFLTSGQMQAFKTLSGMRRCLGPDGYRLLFDVLCERIGLGDAAMARQQRVRFTCILFRGHLERLAIHCGYAQARRHV